MELCAGFVTSDVRTRADLRGISSVNMQEQPWNHSLYGSISRRRLPVKKKPKQIRFKAKARALSSPSRISYPADTTEWVKQYPDTPRRPRIRRVSLDENLPIFALHRT